MFLVTSTIRERRGTPQWLREYNLDDAAVGPTFGFLSFRVSAILPEAGQFVDKTNALILYGQK